MKNDLVTIITANFNDKCGLEKTEKSIKNSSYKEIEWIIIDGGSTDGSLDFFQKSNVVAKWISEPDQGVYDAWNKGIEISEGKWIAFLGAGDMLDPKWLAKAICNSKYCDYDLIYGDLNICTDRYTKIGQKNGASWDWVKHQLLNEMCLPHPAMLHKSQICKTFKFSTEFKIISDWEFFLRAMSNINICLYMQNVNQADMPVGGISSKPSAISTQNFERKSLMILYGLKASKSQNIKWFFKSVLSSYPRLYNCIQKNYWSFRRDIR